MRIARGLYEEMVSHAREEAPNECCGMVAARDDDIVKVYRATNVEASPFRFEVDGFEILAESEPAVVVGYHGGPWAFDLLMLGVGRDAHVASLFPEHPALHERDESAIGVRGAPKPPPIRVSMTFPSLSAARDVWFLVSGADKAGAVGLALSGAGQMQAPAAGVTGIRSTTWLLDRDAATHVPRQLIRLASP